MTQYRPVKYGFRRPNSTVPIPKDGLTKLFQGYSSAEFDFYMAYKEENIIEILNTLELDGYIRIPRNAKKELIKKALEEERNLDQSNHLGRFQFKKN